MKCKTIIIFAIVIYLVAINSSVNSQSKNQLTNKIEPLTSEFTAVGIVYHRFGDNRYSSTNTSIKDFESHLIYLINNGFKTYTISELLNKKLDAGKKVFITIDDGLKSFYDNALPLIKKYNIKVTVFVNTESVGWQDYMTWEQLKEIEKAGVQIGSHSHKHDFFLKYSDTVRVRIFQADLLKSEEEFESNLGHVPRMYAYPYGEFDSSMASVLKKRGYNVAFAQNSGVWNSEANRWSIPRFPVSGEYVNLDAFKEKVNMKPLRVKSNHLYPVELSENEEFRLRLNVENSSLISNVNCFFNNKKYNEFSFEKGVIDIRIHMPPNKRRVLLTFTAKDRKGNWFWWSCVFVNIKY